MDEDTETRSFTVLPESSGMRLDVFLSNAFGAFSRSQVQKLIAAGQVSVNGQVVPKSYLLATTDAVQVTGSLPLDQTVELLPQDIPLSLLYEDEYYIAVDKPAGLVVHPGSGNRNGTLVNALLFHLGHRLSNVSVSDRPGIVHRLDKDTSGVIVVAKTNAAHAALAQAFSSRTVKKSYTGFCIGRPPAASGTIDMPLSRSRSDPVKRTVHELGKASTTEYRQIDFRYGIALVEFLPRTGRTHQIRVHCASSGFPIVADTLYGGGTARLHQLSPLDRPFAASILKCFTRHALHAAAITFTHPFLEKEMTIEAPLPEDFKRALEIYRR
jgi:23S rRNA pseudouridine1911/1915/1917 synthase